MNYINAHATSTLVGDVAELKAVKKVFTDTRHLKMNATKSMIGHCLGAAGGMEAVATIKAITTGWLHPTINHVRPSLCNTTPERHSCVLCRLAPCAVSHFQKATMARQNQTHILAPQDSKFDDWVTRVAKETLAPAQVDPIEETDGIDCVPNEKKQLAVTAGLSSSFGFGGHNSVVCFAPFEE